MLAGEEASMASLIQIGAIANALNMAIRQSTVVLSTQELINVYFHMAIINLQQQIDLLDGKIQTFHCLVKVNGHPQFQSLCLTPNRVSNMFLARWQLSDSLLGPWNRKFVNLIYLNTDPFIGLIYYILGPSTG